MKGILSTTISYVGQNQQKDAWRLNTSNMSAYYLVGQGAVFVIPTSVFRPMEITTFLNEKDIDLDLDLAKSAKQTQIIRMEAQKQAAETPKGLGRRNIQERRNWQRNWTGHSRPRRRLLLHQRLLLRRLCPRTTTGRPRRA